MASLHFRYKARDPFAKLVTGVLEAESAEAAAQRLLAIGLVPLCVSETGAFATVSGRLPWRRVPLVERSVFTRQLFSLQKAGLTILSSLETVARQTKNRQLRDCIEAIARDIRGGRSFSESLRQYPSVFDEVYVSMVRAAETAGNLTDILGRLSGLLEQEIETRSRVRAATRYPLIAFGAILCGAFIVVSFVIPRFALIYGQFKTALPLPTRILIGLSGALRSWWYLFLVAGIAAGFGFSRFIRTGWGRERFDLLRLKVPVFGALATMLIMARFCRVTALLLRSGLPILEILELGAASAGNVVVSRALRQVKESVNQGKGMAEPMRSSGLFPPIVLQMVAVGEQTGKIDELLASAADYYDLESDTQIKNLTTAIEPLLTFVLGLLVLGMALAIFLPMWNLLSLFRSA